MERSTSELTDPLNQSTSDAHETEDDVDSDNSENSDDIDKDFYTKMRKDRSTSPPMRQSNSPTGSTGSPNAPSPGIKRRMSMARPVVHHLPGVVIDAKEDSVFLSHLTYMIAEFPIPPSHIHSKEPEPNSLIDIVGITSLRSFAGSWVSSLRSRNETTHSPGKS
jgi:hypothetical protein